MDVTWLVDEYLGNGKARHAAFSSKRRAIEGGREYKGFHFEYMVPPSVSGER